MSFGKDLNKRVAAHWDKNAKKWRVYVGNQQMLVDEITLQDVQFFVSPEGKQMVRERRAGGQTEKDARFPHAFIFGKIVKGEEPTGTWRPFSYNPFSDEFFHVTGNKSLESIPLIHAKAVRLKPEAGSEVLRNEDSYY